MVYIQTLENESSKAVFRWKLNNNFTEIDTRLTEKALKSNVLELNNTVSFTPTSDYHPATKKYVDDIIPEWTLVVEWDNISLLNNDAWYITDGWLVGTKTVDETNIADGRVIVYNSTSWEYELQDQSDWWATDHWALTWLADDDHTQYHNDTRWDDRYYTKTLLDWWQLDDRYYTETEADNLLDDKQDTLDSGTNIKTINSNSLLGSWDISIEWWISQTENSIGTVTTNTTIDRANGRNQEITIWADITLDFNFTEAWFIQLKITDGWNYTVTWWNTINWAEWTAPSLTSDGTDYVNIYYDGSSHYGDYWYWFA